MKVAILAGGRGTRLGAASLDRPKALVEIAGVPIIERVMNIYRAAGFDSFLVATGHLSEQIESYFSGRTDLDVTCVNTGTDTDTGGRIKRLAKLIPGETFMLTWTDGISDIDINALLAFHRRHGKLATVSAVHPPARFGHLELDNDRVRAFEEKPRAREGWINGAFFVLEPGIIDYIDSDATRFEHAPMANLAKDGQLMAYRHHGFWRCVDTPADIQQLESLVETGEIQ